MSPFQITRRKYGQAPKHRGNTDKQREVRDTNRGEILGDFGRFLRKCFPIVYPVDWGG